MNADLEIERAGTVSLARRGEQACEGTWHSRMLLESVPAEAMSLGLSWDAADCLRLRLEVHNAEGGPSSLGPGVDGEEAWHIGLRMPLSRAQARGLLQFLAFALSQADAE
jgi:hypothetical protein